MDARRPIGFWLKLVDRLIDDQFASTLEQHGVTRRQWQLLNLLSQGTATVEHLDAAVAPFLARGDERGDGRGDGGSEPESSAEHLAELIDSAWVRSGPSGFDLTDRGRIAFDALSEVVAMQRAAAAAGLSSDDYETTVSTLRRMAINLGYDEEPRH